MFLWILHNIICKSTHNNIIFRLNKEMVMCSKTLLNWSCKLFSAKNCSYYEFHSRNFRSCGLQTFKSVVMASLKLRYFCKFQWRFKNYISTSLLHDALYHVFNITICWYFQASIYHKSRFIFTECKSEFIQIPLCTFAFHIHQWDAYARPPQKRCWRRNCSLAFLSDLNLSYKIIFPWMNFSL